MENKEQAHRLGEEGYVFPRCKLMITIYKPPNLQQLHPLIRIFLQATTGFLWKCPECRINLSLSVSFLVCPRTPFSPSDFGPAQGEWGFNLLTVSRQPVVEPARKGSHLYKCPVPCSACDNNGCVFAVYQYPGFRIKTLEH